MAERVNMNVQWVTDDNGDVTGYQVKPGEKRPIGGGGSIQTSARALLGLRRLGLLNPGKTYQVAEGWVYYANSASNFWPLGLSPVLTGERTTLAGDSFNANAVVNGNRQSTLSTIGWAGTQMGVPLEVVSYRAVAGQSWSNLAVSQLAGILADDTDVVEINCGANIWLPVVNSSTIDVAMNSAKAVLDPLSAAKLLVIVNACTPGVAATHDRAGEVVQLNTRLAALCEQYPNVVFNDVYASMVDTASATGDVRADCTYDGVLHPGMKGAMRRGVMTARNLSSKIWVVSRWNAAAVAGAPDFGTTGGVKTAGTGTINGNVPTGMRVWISAGSPVVDLTTKDTLGSAGKRLNVKVSNAAGTACRVDVDLGGASAAFNAGLSAGDTIRGWIGVRIKSIAQLLALYATFQVTGGGGGVTFCFSPHTAADPTPNAEFPFTGRLMLPAQTLGAGFASLNMTFALQFTANAAAAAEFDVWDYGIEKLTPA